MFALTLVDWALRATLLVAVSLLIARLVERRSAAAAHRVLIATFACALLLPVVAMVVPAWQCTLPLATSSPQPIEANVPSEISPGASLPETNTEVFELREQDELQVAEPIAAAPASEVATNSIDPQASEVHRSSSPEAAPAAATDNAPASALVGWRGWALSVWVGGTCALLLRVVFYLARLARHVARCDDASDSLQARVRQLAAECGMKRPVRVKLSTADSMPMACWLGRWVVVVPENLDDWPPQLQRATLLHELGHIARRDAWSDMLAQLAACLLWPSPPVWLAAGEVRRLRERACDEWSLAHSGLDARQYALGLLEVVDRCQAANYRIACAMADKRGFESRLKWLMAKSHRRSGLPFAGALVLTTVLGLAVAIATAEPTRPVASAESESAAMNPVVLSEDPSPPQTTIAVAGTVRNADGQAMSDVPVVLRANLGGIQYASTAFPHTRDVLARTTTNSQGEFRFTDIGIPPRMDEIINKLRRGDAGAQLLCWSDDHALQWLPIESFEVSGKHFQLSAAADVAGVIVDQGDQPVPNARLRVVGLTHHVNTADAFLRAPGDLNLIRSELQFDTRTNAQGEFQMPNMPEGYRISVRCESPVGHNGFFLADTTNGADDSVTYSNGGGGTFSLHRTPMPVSIEQKPCVKIRVVDHQGNPITEGGVEAVNEDRQYGGAAAIGPDGVAVLAVNKPGVHTVYYAGDPLHPVPGLKQTMDIRPGENQPVVLKLPTFRLLTGRVVDSDTGEPVPGVYVRGVRKSEDNTMPDVTSAICVSHADGHFEMPVIEGTYSFSIRHEVVGYFVPTSARHKVELEPDYPTATVTADAVPDDIVIRIGRGLVIDGTLVDEHGNPLAGKDVQAQNEGSPYQQVAGVTDAEGRFQLAGLSPYVATRVTAWSDTGTAQQSIPAAEGHAWDQSLHKVMMLKLSAGTSVVGRVVRGGKPVAGVEVRLRRAGPRQPDERGTRYDLWGETETDEEGMYKLGGLHKGDRYQLEIEPQADAEVRDWVYQSPYFHTMELEDGSRLELPDAELKSHGQTLAGVVVDLDGNPVEGVTVSTHMASGRSLSRPQRGPPPWTKTDAQGRFRLSQLPEEPLSLMTYQANQAGGSIRYPSHTNPKMNQQDIRIVFDPALRELPDDLDARE